MLQSRHPRSRRNLTVETGIRDMVNTSPSADSTRKLLMETRDFMRASRIHAVCPLSELLGRRESDRLQELLKRYTPLADMTEQEKVQAATRKVGLEPPIRYKAPE
jgi:hypothetical protein